MDPESSDRNMSKTSADMFHTSGRKIQTKSNILFLMIPSLNLIFVIYIGLKKTRRVSYTISRDAMERG